ncbi:uncharacterized protein KD926_011288 [Aspergillus affinis]|uniref:uncharacterized protein n=1 Tax=Aspergillus affinis TaxID=1070780 RepID=UPI0022FF37F5|nr:uncharacterized protein KD926_011288 [Aspergillus affinis]KAI9038050.1 hypothetical protein KD926_011288 [Aspergillus affinis]
MGTRGLFFVRCRGRYFAYYNHFDSYPDGLGSAIIQQIPENRDEYREWLQAMRVRYSKLATHYEGQCLPVSVKADQSDPTGSLPERYIKSFLSVDDRLEHSPLQIVMPDAEIWFIEWTYTLDLDREVFTVDNVLHFKLTKIPRYDRWIYYIDKDGYERRAFKPFTPEEIIGDVTCTPHFSQASKNRYKCLGPEVMPPRSLVSDSEEVVIHREALFWVVFSLTHQRYSPLLDQFYLEWGSGSFAFRELAFAFLSITAGEMSFESPRSLNGNYSGEGYFLIPEDRLRIGQQSLLPRFLHESHAAGFEPGSAPRETTYWMNNVLIHLVTRTDLVDVEEAAVAEVVDFGLNAGVNRFYAMVFSILDVVLIRVQTNQDGTVHVRRSPLMALVHFNDNNSRFVNGPRSRQSVLPQKTTTCPGFDVPPPTGKEIAEDGNSSHPAESNDVENEGEKEGPATIVKESYEDEDFTFSMMLRFFDAASEEHLAGEKSRIFPNEIMATVLEFSDMRTHEMLRRTSACCQQLGNRRIRLSDNYAVVGADRRQAPEQFFVEDLRTGERIKSTVSYSARSYHYLQNEDKSIELNPVIGIADPSSTRVSIIDRVSFYLSDLYPSDPKYTGKTELPWYEKYRYTGGFADSEADNKLLDMPTYLYPGSFENAWGRFITAVIRSGDNSAYRFVMLNNAKWMCLLPPRYRQLRMDHLFCNGLQAFVRHPDDESPVEWQQTINYAIAQLGLTDRVRPREQNVKGRPVLVGFGTKARLYYYVYRRNETPAVPANASSYSVRIADSCTKLDGRHRLVELYPGGNPLNIQNPEDRAKLEDWLLTFRGNDDFGTEWDPIAESRQRIECGESKTTANQKAQEVQGEDASD